MKKIIVMCFVFLTCFTVACGKKEEVKPGENNPGANNPPSETNPSDKEEITEEDLKKITSEMKIEKIDEKKSKITLTYKNESSKSFKVTNLKVSASKDGKELGQVTKKLDEVVPAGKTKEFVVELNVKKEILDEEKTELHWEITE